MRLNQQQTRENLIEALSALCPNKSHLPWGKEENEIHSYLLTIAEMNMLGRFETSYQGYSLGDWKVFKPIAEVAILPSRVVTIVDDYAQNLINVAKYQVAREDFLHQQIETRINEEDGTERTVRVSYDRNRRPMTLPEFNQFTLKLIIAFRGNSNTDSVAFADYHKEAVLPDVVTREVVGGKVRSLETHPLHLNTQTFMSETYVYDADVSEKLFVTAHIRRWYENK